MVLSDFTNQNHFRFRSGHGIDILQQMRIEIIREHIIEKGYPDIAALEDYNLINVEIITNPSVKIKTGYSDNVTEIDAVFKVKAL